MGVVKQKQIGNIQNNKVDDVQLVRKVLSFNKKVLQMGFQGKPKNPQEFAQRIDDYFQLCIDERRNSSLGRCVLGYCL